MKITGPVRVVGTMSGTSLDGVDAAAIETDGISITGFGKTAYRPYSDFERATIRAALGRWPGDHLVAAAAEVVELAHAEILAGFQSVVLAGFHGQTLAHDPANRRTHQAGDGEVLAEALGLPVIWDFRSSDVGLGGQGAPLVPFYHWALARWIGAQGPVVFLNLGGVGNLTWVDPMAEAPEAEGALVAFDTGPANAPLDDLMRSRRGAGFDEGGALAASGTIDMSILGDFLAHPYFAKMPPKSLDRNDFHGLLAPAFELSDADAAATLTGAAAMSVVAGLGHLPGEPERILVTGGGRKNPVLMEMLARGAGCPVDPVEAVGLDGDMLEAQAFAFLAVRVARGLPTSAPGTTGVPAPVGGGRISRPG